MRLYFGNRGNTLTEYAMIFGLVSLLGVVAVQALGGSTSDLLGGVKQSEKPMLQMASLNFAGASATAQGIVSGGSVAMKGAGYYAMAIDPATGNPSLRLTDSNTGTVTNATSIDGSQWNTLGQFHLADSLRQLAKTQTDPASRAYISKLAEISYYMGGAEGEIDGMGSLELGDAYGKVYAYRDLQRFQTQMQTMVNNPPAGLDRQTLLEVLPLTADVYNIGQTYVSAVQPVIQNNPGIDFIMPSTLTELGTGQPAQALNNQLVPCDISMCGAPTPNGMTIEDVFTLPQLQDLSQKVLSNYQVATEPVKATFTDATVLDNTATTGAPSATTPSASP